MPSVRLARLAVLALAATTLAAAPAEAQLGGLKARLKQKAAETIADKAVDKAAGAVPGGAGPAAAPVAAPAAAPSGGATPPADAAKAEEPSVLPLVDANLDRLVAALAAEGEARREAAQAKAAYEKARDAHGTCFANVMQTPEYQKLGAKAQALVDANDIPAAHKVLTEEQPAMIAKACGEAPEYSEPRDAIRKKALAAGRFTDWQYSVIEERVLPYCQIAARGSHYLKRDVRLVYTAEEEAALQPRCAALVQAYEAVR